jgi:hypothetical protein
MLRLLRFGLFFILMAFPLAGTSFSYSLLPFENTTEEIGRGFGNTLNRYAWSMEDFNNEVYVGTWNAQMDWPRLFTDAVTGNLSFSGNNPLEGISYLYSEGAEIWRYRENSWSQVLAGNPTDTGTGFREIIRHEGKLYAATANSETGTKLFVSETGEPGSWHKIPGGPSGDKDNNSIRTMISHQGTLYVGTENNDSGGELWGLDSGSWKLKEKFANDSAVSELLVKDGTMYAGTWDFTDSFQLHKSLDAGFEDYERATPDNEELNGLANLGVMKLIEYKGSVYLGTVNYTDGFTLLRSTNPEDSGSWKVISLDGFGDQSNAYTWAMQEFNGKLYLGTFNSGLYGGRFGPLPMDGRAELWVTSDGWNWDLVMDDGFGSMFNYGIRSMTVSNNRLFAGTASTMPLFDPCTYDWTGYEAMFAQYGIDFSPAGLMGLYDNEQWHGLVATLFSHGDDPWIGCEVWASQPVPEPGTWLLLAAGLLGLAGIGRSRLLGKRK